MKAPKILFCGDSPVGGAANYLLGVLGTITPHVKHVPPGNRLDVTTSKKSFDAILLSDYSYAQLSRAAEKNLLKQVEAGAGLMMIGGWASFSGPFGGWYSSDIESILPVKCRAKDDRLNFPGGAHLFLSHKHDMMEGISFKNTPAIVGLNDVKAKKKSSTIISVRKVVSVGTKLTYDPVDHPLLVTDSDPNRRIAAYTSDFAPHWCGGLVDWGPRHKKLTIAKTMQVEVGTTYIQFVSQIIRWLSGQN